MCPTFLPPKLTIFFSTLLGFFLAYFDMLMPHPNLSIGQAKWLQVCRTKWLIQQSCEIFYNNFQLLYIKNYYLVDHIWNSGEIGIQVGK
jgi:hypothetical protein